ncbi:MAG: T9SS C-terminal target domain-containing protein [Gemmatimonadetes bacterium]|nr:MAG: T9SS C-terminal target domain-containing protein [Gemmatimonadota bacterium]
MKSFRLFLWCLVFGVGVVSARTIEHPAQTFVANPAEDAVQSAPRTPGAMLRTPPPEGVNVVAEDIMYGNSFANYPLIYGYIPQVVRITGSDDVMSLFESGDNDESTATDLRYGSWTSDFQFWDHQSLLGVLAPIEPTGVRRKTLAVTSDGIVHAFFAYTTVPTPSDRNSLQMAYLTYDHLLQAWTYEGNLNLPSERGFSFPMARVNSLDEIYLGFYRYNSAGNLYFDWKNQAGEWQGLTQVVGDPTNRGENFPHIAVDPVTHDAYLFWHGDVNGDGWPDMRGKRFDHETETWEPAALDEGETVLIGGPEHFYYPYESPEEVNPDNGWLAPCFPNVVVDQQGYIHVVTYANPIAPADLDQGLLSGYYDVGFGGLMYYCRSQNPRDMSAWTTPQKVFADTLHEGLAGAGSMAIDEDDNLYLVYTSWDTVLIGLTEEGDWGVGLGDATEVRMSYFHWMGGDEDGEDWWSAPGVLYSDAGDTSAGISAKIPGPTTHSHAQAGWGLDVMFNLSYGAEGSAPAFPHDILYVRAPYQPVEWYTSVPVEQQSTAVPKIASLHQNYPNPFNPQTTIRYDLAQASPVKLGIYNLKGELIRTLVDQSHTAGSYTVYWDGKNQQGEAVASGMYSYRLVTPNQTISKPMILLR